VGFLQGVHDLRAMLIVITAVSIAGLVLFILFVTKAADSLIRARESLLHSETLASMGRMAAGIAHEIRNPLFIIRSSAEKIRALHPESSSDIDFFILEEVDRLNSVLTDYLLFARNESTSRQEVDLVKILSRCVNLVEESERGRGVVVVTDFKVSSASVWAEEKKLQQVFLNILINARQAIEEKGEISISLSRSGVDYRIEFEDSGSGIPSRNLDKVFEPFYSTKATGSGLGLAISRKVIEDHGGTIEIESREGAGTKLIITIPGDTR
ncbi:MAG: hypothetical protein JXB45_10435, partial [Candidatus Krumholzibacteriota bacterium]|nr:hypothetical protein [Candidatus Krumholzibacteriota bacterium]